MCSCSIIWFQHFVLYICLAYFCVLLVISLLGILQWYQSIILAQPVVYDIRKEIIQSNSSAIPETQLEKGPK